MSAREIRARRTRRGTRARRRRRAQACLDFVRPKDASRTRSHRTGADRTADVSRACLRCSGGSARFELIIASPAAGSRSDHGPLSAGRAAQAHRRLDRHVSGRMVLRIHRVVSDSHQRRTNMEPTDTAPRLFPISDGTTSRRAELLHGVRYQTAMSSARPISTRRTSASSWSTSSCRRSRPYRLATSPCC